MKESPVYVIQDGDVTVDALIGKVWPHLLKYYSWQKYSIVEHVSGPAGEEGEVVLLKKEEGNATSPPYYARTIKLDPGRRIVWKTFRTESATFGIVDFQLHEMPGATPKTRFHWSVVYEYIVPHETQAELDAYRTQQTEYFGILSAAVFPRLKDLAEADS